MAEPFLGEVRLFSFGFPPRGWALCNGQALPINQNQALFSLLGTTYGGDGVNTFALPNLQGRTAMHAGSAYPQGSVGGETSHTLIASEMPAHTHTLTVNAAPADQNSAAGRLLGAAAGDSLPAVYAPPSAPLNAPLNSAAILPIGGSQPHDNMPPYLTINFCIALQGIYPNRN